MCVRFTPVMFAWAALLLIGVLLLAFWTKQSVVAALGAVGVFLLWRDWRSALRWGIVAGLALVGPFLLLNFISKGQLYSHMNVGSAYGISLGRLKQNMTALFIANWPLLIIAVAGLVFLAVRLFREREKPPLSF